MLDITERMEAEEKLRWSLGVLRQTLQQRRELARRLQNAQESERQRIAADLHDDPIQVMSGVDMRLQMLAEFPNTVTLEAIAGIESEVQAAIERLRSMLFELRPAALDREGLVPALRTLARQRSGPQVLVHVDGLKERLPPPIETALYRIAQEALTNANKYARASRIDIDLQSLNGSGVRLQVRDDGVGFDPDSIPDTEERGRTGLGLFGMRERATLLRGTLEVHSAPSRGTEVVAELPLEDRHAG